MIYSEMRRITTAVAEAMVDTGKSLATVLKDGHEDRVTQSTLHRWFTQHPELKTIIDDARTMMMEKAVEEIIEIADQSHATKGDAAKARVRIMARERAAVLMAPRRFKQVTDVTTNDKPLEGGIVVNDNRLQSLIYLAAERKRNEELRRALLDD